MRWAAFFYHHHYCYYNSLQDVLAASVPSTGLHGCSSAERGADQAALIRQAERNHIRYPVRTLLLLLFFKPPRWWKEKKLLPPKCCFLHRSCNYKSSSYFSIISEVLHPPSSPSPTPSASLDIDYDYLTGIILINPLGKKGKNPLTP